MQELQVGNHSQPSRQILTSADHPGQLQSVEPLSRAKIAATLRYLVPPDPYGMPMSLLSTQLKRRHHYLGIEPEDQQAYLCLNPDHPSQDTTKVFSIFHKLSGQNLGDLAGSVFYSYDGELVAHVILDGAIQICFDWEAKEEDGIVTGYEWKYLDSKPLPLPSIVYDNVQQAINAQSKEKSLGASFLTNGTSSPAGDDAYWSRYDSVLPSVSNGRVPQVDRLKAPLPRNGSAAGLSQRSSSPRREDAYWERYGYTDEDEEAETTLVAAPIVAPVSNFDRLGEPTIHILQSQQPVWPGHPTNFAPEELSQALTMHLKPDREGSFNDARGLFLNFDTPSSGGNSPNIIDLSSPIEHSSHSVHPDKSAPQQSNGNIAVKDAKRIYDNNEQAIVDASRALFALWKSTRASKEIDISGSGGEKEAFLSLISQSLVDL